MSEQTIVRVPTRGRMRVFGTVSALLAGLGSLLIAAIMLLINADVLGRALFETPVPIVAEVVSVTIVSIVFLQLADCIRSGGMIQSDMLLVRLGQRSPVARAWVEAVQHAIGTVLLGLIVWYIREPVVTAFTQERTVGIYGVATLPLWPFYAAVLIGAIAATIQYALSTARFVGEALRGGAEGSGHE